MIKAAINGSRTKQHHARLPFTAEQAAHESSRCIAVGAEAIHVHVWAKQVKESLHPDDVTHFLKTIRHVNPEVPIGISTGAWIEPSLQKRLELIANWGTLPDFVSLNFDEEYVEQVADVLLEKRVGIEAGIANVTAAKTLAAWPKRNLCLRILLEPEAKTVKAAKAQVEEIETVLDKQNMTLPRLLHGHEDTTWPMLELAAECGYDTRIGFEDSIYLPDGRVAKTNEQLVKAAANVFQRYAA